MFENIKELLRTIVKSRLLVAVAAIIALFSLLLWRVFYLQIVNGASYQDNYRLRIVKERTLNSTRGNILDRNGKILAYNELSYTVTIEDNGTYSSTSVKNERLNAEIAQIVEALEKNGDGINNDFRIDYDEKKGYSFNVDGNARRRFLADVYGKTSYDKLAEDTKLAEKLGYQPAEASEEQIMEYLLDNYSVDESYDTRMAYQIAVIRFAMAQNAFQKYITTTVATNISEESVAYLNEHNNELQGVEVLSDTIRKYTDSVYFTSIVGYTGKISDQEYMRLSAENDSYTLNDIVGKGGIEQYMDAELKGEKGYEKLYTDHMGKVLQVIERKEPAAGNDVYLSIDSDLQIAVYNLLEQEIAGIVYSNIENAHSDINIPITDVYFALIDNNVIDIEAFGEIDATATEREIWQIFSDRQSAVLGQVRAELMGEGAKPFAELAVEYQDYITFIIDYLKSESILVKGNIDVSDEVYTKWQSGSISPQEYLNYAISMNWIDITNFAIEEKYSDSTEIYEALCKTILEEIQDNIEFSKIIYEYLIDSGSISGRQLCLVLYDQKKLDYDAEEIESLKNGSANAVGFLKEKIKSLDITPAQLALDPCSGSCVITDVNTGELLALVSYPGYDGNRLANTVDSDYFNSLQNDKSLPQYNYATQQGTAPGSTYKMVISTAGLAEGVINTTEQIVDKGEYENVDNHPKCWAYPGSTHGAINVSQAIRHSCNYFFYEVGYRFATDNYLTGYDADKGIDVITKYADMFGLNETTGIEIEESAPHVADDFPVMAAIGQSNNKYSTVQLARYVTAVANSGTVYEYTLLNRLEDSKGNVLKTFEPKVRNTIDVLDANQWNSIHSGMRMVVENNRAFKDFPVTAAGKTGTAQQIPTRPNHALFVGYAPYEQPEISIAARIAYGYTSSNAADLVRNVLSYYFNVENHDELLSGEATDITSAGTNAFAD